MNAAHAMAVNARNASGNHPLINGNQIAAKDTNKINLSEVGDGVFSFISGAASGVAASLSMGLSDIFVINDDNKNETVYLVGRLTGAVVVATVAIVMTVRSGASAVSTAPTVVGTAVSVASAVDNGGKAISAIGVAGDTINTLIANNSGGSGNTGSLVIETGGKFSASEIKAAEYMKSLGNDVILRMPQGTRVGGGTSDLLVNGIRYDVYTPITAKPDNIISAIARKNQQTTGVVLDLSQTSVTSGQLGNVLARVNGAGATNIKEIIILP